jgi:hypothetical protein
LISYAARKWLILAAESKGSCSRHRRQPCEEFDGTLDLFRFPMPRSPKNIKVRGESRGTSEDGAVVHDTTDQLAGKWTGHCTGR